VRVLFVTHNFPRTSGDLPGNFVLRLARALRELDVAVHVLAPHGPQLRFDETVDGIPVTRFRYAPDHRETLAYTGTMAAQVQQSLRAKFDLLSMIRSASRAMRPLALESDVVHAHWWFPSGLAAGAGARAGRPLVTTLHGSDVRLARGALPRHWMRRVLRSSSRVTAVSQWLADEAVRLAAVTRPEVLPMPVDTELFTPANVPRDGVLFVGKLDAQKGAAILLEALTLTAKSVTATIVGDGADARALHARAAALGVAGRVRWCGALPHAALPPFYRAARLVIAPATAPEGLGLSAAEAQLCETPVIASRVGGLPDLVDDGVTGVLVPPNDAAALAGAIDASIGLPDQLAAWGREGRMRVLARFSPAACAAQYRDVYTQAVNATHA
jgi:glycosyltransferase involved in cell wall biosynthesis